MSPTATWPLGSHVNKGDREGTHGAHLNLRTVTTTCIVTVWTSWHIHCPAWSPSIIVVHLLGWWGGSPSIVVVRPLGWRGGLPSVVVVSDGL